MTHSSSNSELVSKASQPLSDQPEPQQSAPKAVKPDMGGEEKKRKKERRIETI